MMSGNDEWPFVLWLFVRVAFCPVAFCRWPFDQRPFVRVVFCPKAYKCVRGKIVIYIKPVFTEIKNVAHTMMIPGRHNW